MGSWPPFTLGTLNLYLKCKFVLKVRALTKGVTPRVWRLALVIEELYPLLKLDNNTPLNMALRNNRPAVAGANNPTAPKLPGHS